MHLKTTEQTNKAECHFVMALLLFRNFRHLIRPILVRLCAFQSISSIGEKVCQYMREPASEVYSLQYVYLRG